MRLDNQEAYNFLADQGINSLHHANSLATSLTFIQNNGLLSRGAVEEKNLFQTKQSSDEDDKTHKVWHDIFFDSKDLHGYFPRQNIYGPILFKFSSLVMLNPDIQIFITKNNPQFWTSSTKEEDKYFLDIDELQKDWSKYQLHRKMVTFRFKHDILPFDNLESVTVDNPNVIIYADTELFKESYYALNNLMSQHGQLQGKLLIRECTQNPCYCRKNYLEDYSALKLAKFFLPFNHARFNNN